MRSGPGHRGYPITPALIHCSRVHNESSLMNERQTLAARPETTPGITNICPRRVDFIVCRGCYRTWERNRRLLTKTAAEINRRHPRSMADLASFVADTDERLAVLPEERAVLRACQDWPLERYETMREAAALHRELAYFTEKQQTWSLLKVVPHALLSVLQPFVQPDLICYSDLRCSDIQLIVKYFLETGFVLAVHCCTLLEGCPEHSDISAGDRRRHCNHVRLYVADIFRES